MERPIKPILVSIYFKGRTHTKLMHARKVGKHYQISIEAYNKFLNEINIQRGQTFSIG